MWNKIFILSLSACMALTAMAQDQPVGIRVEASEYEVNDEEQYTIFSYLDESGVYGYYLSLAHNDDKLTFFTEGIHQIPAFVQSVLQSVRVLTDNVMGLINSDEIKAGLTEIIQTVISELPAIINNIATIISTLMEIVIDDDEAEIIRMIFDMTVKQGYGSYRMSELLNEKGIRTHTGSKFQCNTINRILRNRLYCGYMVSGGVESERLERLQIIDQNIFDQAQFILQQRSQKNDQKQQIARTTKGSTLLRPVRFHPFSGEYPPPR